MKILIVEDDPNKYKQISEFLGSIVNVSAVTIRNSYQSGLREILFGDYDCVILDMSLPTYDVTVEEEGGPFITFAGEDILSEMTRRNKQTPTIVITQFESFGLGEEGISLDELKERLRTTFLHNYVGTIYYSASETSWKEEINYWLKEINRA